MESVLTVRLDSNLKERGTHVMRQCGFTPSQAVRNLFDYVVANNGLPFVEKPGADKDAVRERIRAFDRCHTKEPLTLSDEELRDERLRERYGFDA